MSFLLVDKITQYLPGKSISGVKHISAAEPYLTLSPSSQTAIFMPSLVGEAVGQLAAWAVMDACQFKQRPVAGIVAQVNIFGEVKAGVTLTLHAEIDQLDDEAVEYHGHASVNGNTIFEIVSAIGPMVPMQEMIDVEVVRHQFQSIVPEETTEANSLKHDFPVKNFPELEPINAHNPLGCFDNLLALEKEGPCIAEKLVSQSAPYFSDHFPHKPVLPLTILLNCKIEFAQHYIKNFYSDFDVKIRCARKIKMSQFVQPGSVVCTAMQVKQKGSELIFKFKSHVDAQRVCICEVVFDIP